MSNHNLFYHGTDGAIERATSAQILATAREVLAHRVRRGALLQSPKKVSAVEPCRILIWVHYGILFSWTSAPKPNCSPRLF